MITRFRSSRLLNTRPIWCCQLCDYEVASKKGMELHARMTHEVETKLKGQKKSEVKEVIKKQKRERIGVCYECGKDMSLHSRKNGNCP